MSQSKTFAQLCARQAKHQLGRAVAQGTAWTMGAIGTLAGASITSRVFEPDDPAWPVVVGVAIGAGIIAAGRFGINQLLQPIFVTADDFDAIEDELSGFDTELLALFQRCHGSRPMDDFDTFMANALEHGGPSDFTAASFYLSTEAGVSVGQRLCYSFESVKSLVEADRLLSARPKPSDDAIQGESPEPYVFSLVTPPAPRTRLDRICDRPVLLVSVVCIVGALLAAAATTAVFYAL